MNQSNDFNSLPQEYLQLIQALLACRDGEEGDILAANEHLINVDLIHIMQLVVNQFDKQGNNNANSLRNLAQNLAQYMEDFQSTQAHYDFLLETLKTINNGASQEQVYNLFQENLDKIHIKLAQVLSIYTNHILLTSELKTQKRIAFVINNFSNLMRDFPLGNRGMNLEIAIAGYQIILTIYTETDFPENWAATQYNLANAYFNRIKGDRADNLEMAIASYHQALRIYTETDFPLEWAMSQNNLASAYSNRIKGDRAENLEMAIASYHNALRIYTPEELPIECLQTSRNLGNLHFTGGKWALAIKAYDRAINAVETSHICATKDDRCQEIIAELIKVYEKIVRACINNQQIGKAVEYVKRSLSPRLVDLMASNNLYANGNIPEQVQEYLREYEDL